MCRAKDKKKKKKRRSDNFERSSTRVCRRFNSIYYTVCHKNVLRRTIRVLKTIKYARGLSSFLRVLYYISSLLKLRQFKLSCYINNLNRKYYNTRVINILL